MVLLSLFLFFLGSLAGIKVLSSLRGWCLYRMEGAWSWKAVWRQRVLCRFGQCAWYEMSLSCLPLLHLTHPSSWVINWSDGSAGGSRGQEWRDEQFCQSFGDINLNLLWVIQMKISSSELDAPIWILEEGGDESLSQYSVQTRTSCWNYLWNKDREWKNEGETEHKFPQHWSDE